MEDRYKPSAVRRVRIPKDRGKWRLPGIPVVAGRAVQKSIAKVLSAICEALFMDGSYGFRPAQGAHDAIRAVQGYLKDGVQFAVWTGHKRTYVENRLKQQHSKTTT